MSTLKLTADGGGGTIALKGPAATTGNNDFILTLPANDGSADEALKTNGSGTLSWGAVSAGGASNISFNSGNGIDFSSTSDGTTMSSELFDDYEEGSFTVTDISGGSLTFTSQANRYTKVGRVVHIMVNITFPTTSNANAMKFGGVPFAIEGGTTSSGIVSLAGGYANGVQIHMDSAGMHATYDGSLAIGGFSNNQFSAKQVCFALTYST